MTIVTVAVTDSSPTPHKWEMPANPDSLRSPVPRGIVHFHGTSSIALKAAGDETAYNLEVIMPMGFSYLPRDIMIRSHSDDLVNTWELLGLGLYDRRSRGGISLGGNGSNPFSMICPGLISQRAATGERVWVPSAGTPKLLLAGLDSIEFFLSDMDSGETTAGDIGYSMQFYVYDVDQVDKWEINSPLPVISHAAF